MIDDDDDNEFIGCPSRPSGSYAASNYKYRGSHPLLAENKLFLVRIASPSAPAGSIPTDSLPSCSVSVHLLGLSWPSSVSVYQ